MCILIGGIIAGIICIIFAFKMQSTNEPGALCFGLAGFMVLIVTIAGVGMATKGHYKPDMKIEKPR